MINCVQCRNVFRVIGDALNLKLETPVMLEMAANALVDQFDLKAVHFRLLSRDQRTLDDVASYGLSQRFLDKGPVDAERSISEAMKGHVVAVADCATDPRMQYPRECAEEGLRSVLTVPLETRGQVIGVMRVFTGERREFRPDEVELFKVAAVFCSSAIIDCMFHKILRHVTESIRSTLELPEVVGKIVTVVSEDLRAKGCVIHLLDDATSKLQIRAANGLAQAFTEDLVDAFSSDVAHEVLSGRSVAIYDARSDALVEAQHLMQAEGVASILLTPLLRRQKVIGVMSLFTFKPYVFSVEEKQLLEAIGEQCSLAIDNAKMFAALKQRYDSLVDDFNLWFEHTGGVPNYDVEP